MDSARGGGWRQWRAHPRPGGERGSVLLETALAIPLLMAVAVALAWALSLAGAGAAMGDAASTAARGLARGEPTDDVVARARSELPRAEVSLEDAGADVAVSISQDVSPPVPFLGGLVITVSRHVVIPREWT